MGLEEYSVEELKARADGLQEAIFVLYDEKKRVKERLATLLYEQGDPDWKIHYFMEVR